MRNLFWIIVMALLACGRENQPADLIVKNAVIWTANDALPRASALAIKDGKIAWIGDTGSEGAWLGPETEIYDADGQFITPGFIDCHVHFFTGGINLSSVQLRDAQTPEEFGERIRQFAEQANSGSWILGGDWDHENWGGSLPDRSWIDQWTPNHPVFVNRLDGHMALANSLALELAGINEISQNPDGGEIIKDIDGRVTGILKDNAMFPVVQAIPARSETQLDHDLETAMNHVAAQGVTSVHHVAGTEPVGYMEAFKRARERNSMITRVYVLTPLAGWRKLKGRMTTNGIGDDWLKIGGLKGYVDGSLGSHTAAFHDPYSDDPTYNGIYINPKDSLYQWIREADREGMQVAVHAIGDEAIESLLDIYERVGKENGSRDRRFRVEHAQHIAQKDLARFSELDIIASMQPYHAIDDGRWAEKLIGPDRIQTTYAFRSLLDENTKLVFGSDWAVAPPTPLDGIYAAVTRRTLDDLNPDGWVPEQKISVEEALKAYTIDAAFASFDDEVKGSLEVGKYADFVVMNKNLLAIESEEIRKTRIISTFVGGIRVFEE